MNELWRRAVNRRPLTNCAELQQQQSFKPKSFKNCKPFMFQEFIALADFIWTNIHVHLIFITTDRMSLHCKQLTLKVEATLAKVLARQQSLPPVELTLLSAVTQHPPQGSRIEKMGREKKRRRRGYSTDGLLLQSAIVLYLAPLLSPLLPRLFTQNSSFHCCSRSTRAAHPSDLYCLAV